MSLDRVFLLNPGQSLDLGDRRVAAFRPPVYDSPATTGSMTSAPERVLRLTASGHPWHPPIRQQSTISVRCLLLICLRDSGSGQRRQPVGDISRSGRVFGPRCNPYESWTRRSCCAHICHQPMPQRRSCLRLSKLLPTRTHSLGPTKRHWRGCSPSSNR
jgi:hypothetical protein